jgi:hypothetical protein
MRVNRRVSIWKHVRLVDGKWRYCRPVPDARGKIIPDMVMVKGREERHPEGNYVISFYNPSLTWQKCGPKPADAVAAAERQRTLFNYSEQELGKFFAKCNARQWVIFKTLLMAGLRESELVFLTFNRLQGPQDRVRSVARRNRA